MDRSDIWSFYILISLRDKDNLQKDRSFMDVCLKLKTETVLLVIKCDLWDIFWSFTSLLIKIFYLHTYDSLLNLGIP